MTFNTLFKAGVLTVFGSVSMLSSTSLMALESNQDKFFNQIKALCGKAFSGGIVQDTSNSMAYRGKKFILHIRDCSDTQIKMPLHIDDNSSRILILTKRDTKSGVSIKLQHDHRHQDGTSDDLTLYGGSTTDSGTVHIQDFPESAESIELTKAHAPTRTWPSVWSIHLSSDDIVYQVVRPGRTIQTKFKLSNTVANPPKAWDLSTGTHY